MFARERKQTNKLVKVLIFYISNLILSEFFKQRKKLVFPIWFVETSLAPFLWFEFIRTFLTHSYHQSISLIKMNSNFIFLLSALLLLYVILLRPALLFLSQANNSLTGQIEEFKLYWNCTFLLERLEVAGLFSLTGSGAFCWRAKVCCAPMLFRCSISGLTLV